MGVNSGSVMPSGVGFCLEFDSFVTDVSSGNEVQSVILSGQPSGGTFTLADSGHASSAIPTTPSPPYRYHQWNKTDLTPGTYDLSANMAQYGTSTTQQLFEIFDDTTLLLSVTLNNATTTGNPTAFADVSLTRHSGGPLMWTPLGVSGDSHPGRFTFTSTNLHVRVSCDSREDGNDRWTADNLRIATTDGATVVRLDTGSPAVTVAPGFQVGTSATIFEVAGESNHAVEVDGLGAGVRYLVDPASAQSALEGVSSIGTGNVGVSGDGSSLNPLLVEFMGTLAGVARSLLVATDPAVTVAEVHVGGILPQLIDNGGSPIQVPYSWIFFDKSGQHMPTVCVYPPVCSPTPVYRAVKQYNDGTQGNLLDNGSDGNWQLLQAGYYGQTYTTAGSTAKATWVYGPWKGATYRLSAAWTAAGGQSTSVVYTIKDLNGTTLGSHTVDQTIAPSGASEEGVPWEVLGTYTLTGEAAGFIVVMSNGTSATMVANGIRFERTSSDDTLRIGSGDTIGMVWGAGWATTVSGGPISAQSSPITLTNLVGGKFVGDLPTSHQCEVGYNMNVASSNAGSALYADFTAMGVDVLAAWPTVLSAIHQDFGVNNAPGTFDADGKAWPNVPVGDYVLAWKGAGNASVVSAGSAVTEQTGLAVYPGTSGSQNQRTYTLGADSTRYGAEIVIRLSGVTIIGSGPTWTTDVTDVHLYPAGTDLSSPPKYRDDWLSRESGTQCRRHLDPLGAIAASPTSYADYQVPQSQVSKCSPARRITTTVSSIVKYTGSTWNLDATQGGVFLVTTPTAHGFDNNQYLHFSDNFSGVVTLDDSTSYPLAGADGFVYVVDSTHFVFQSVFTGHNRFMTNTITSPTGTIFVDAGNGISLQDLVETFNANSDANSFYFNSAATSTEDAITQCFTYLGNNLKAGARVRHECMNETWNQGVLNRLCQANSFVFGYGGSGEDIPYKCHLSADHWGWAKAAWIATGRSGSDFIRVMGSQHVNPGVTKSIVDYCVANSLDFGDEVATAPYLSCSTAYPRDPRQEGSFAALLSRLTVEQTLDQNEVYFQLGGYDTEIQGHLDQIHPSFPDVTSIFYEMNAQTQNLWGTNGIQVNHGVVRHPRWKAIFGYLLGVYAGSGCTANHIFEETGGDTPAGYVWPVYNCTGQLPYTQSTLQDGYQINTPDRMDLIQSVPGAAVNDFAARFDASPTPDFSVAVTGSGSLVQGSTTPRTVTLTAINSFTGSAVLSVVSGLPSGVTAGFSPGTVTGGGTTVSTLTLTASGSATTGTVTLTIQGLDSADSLTHTATTSLTVTAAAQPSATTSSRRRFIANRRHRSARR